MESGALRGSEVLASAFPSWASAAKAVNEAQYQAAKMLLGLERQLLGRLGHAKILIERQFRRRLAAKVAYRIIMIQARLLIMKKISPVAKVMLAALAQIGPTWLDHARKIEEDLEVEMDCATWCSGRIQEDMSNEERKR